MDPLQPAQRSSQDKLSAYLSRFKSDETTLTSLDTTDDNTLEQFLLERTARELRAAQEGSSTPTSAD